jgi:hypothetical protein
LNVQVWLVSPRVFTKSAENEAAYPEKTAPVETSAIKTPPTNGIFMEVRYLNHAAPSP